MEHSGDLRKIERSFEVSPSKSSAEIAEAFGIEGGHEKTVLDVEIPKELPQVVYITGESGCGKTTLLKELSDGDTDVGRRELPDGPLWTWANDLDTALDVLSKVGLGDATLFVSTYEELSDSQQYRARLYYALLGDEDVLYMDEFLSTLDRDTAKAVAYVFQKAIRRTGKSVVVATAHDDLGLYLQPDMTIRGSAFPSRWEVVNHGDRTIENPFFGGLRFEWKDSDWYRECDLAELHYKGKYTGGVKDYLAVYHEGKLVGLLVGKYRMHDGGRRIARVVTHPSYRSVGIGQAAVQRYLEKEPAADVVAEMAKYNPVFERAGMERVENSVVRPPSGLKTALDEMGFDRDRWHRKSYCVDFMQERENREKFAEYAPAVGKHVAPGGKNLDTEEIREKLVEEPHTAGRVLWNVREKEMAKFVGPEYG